jgi:hypothetical protein
MHPKWADLIELEAFKELGSSNVTDLIVRVAELAVCRGSLNEINFDLTRSRVLLITAKYIMLQVSCQPLVVSPHCTAGSA